MVLFKRLFCNHEWDLIEDEYFVFQRVCNKCSKREDVAVLRAMNGGF